MNTEFPSVNNRRHWKKPVEKYSIPVYALKSILKQEDDSFSFQKSFFSIQKMILILKIEWILEKFQTCIKKNLKKRLSCFGESNLIDWRYDRTRVVCKVCC